MDLSDLHEAGAMIGGPEYSARRGVGRVHREVEGHLSGERAREIRRVRWLVGIGGSDRSLTGGVVIAAISYR